MFDSSENFLQKRFCFVFLLLFFVAVSSCDNNDDVNAPCDNSNNNTSSPIEVDRIVITNRGDDRRNRFDYCILEDKIAEQEYLVVRSYNGGIAVVHMPWREKEKE